MSFALGLLIPLAILAGLIALGVRAWRGRHDEEGPSGELIPYLLLALAVGVTAFSLAELAAAALVPSRIVGEPTARIAFPLAGIVVAGPVALLIWRRQADRRETRPEVSGWPVYLALVDLVFLGAFFVAVGEVSSAWFGRDGAQGEWTDLVVFGGVVAFHWWARRRERPRGEIGALPLVIGSAVALVSLATGLVGTLEWLFSLAYRTWSPLDVPDPAIPVALAVTALPVWWWRWLGEAAEDPGRLTGFYLGAASTSGLSAMTGASVAIAALAIGFALGQGSPAGSQFRSYPLAAALLVVSAGVWSHHRRRLDETRRGAARGYRYAMTALGLAGIVATGTTLIDAVFRPRLLGAGSGQALITLGLSTLVSGAVWWWFWQSLQSAPRPEEAATLPRRMYLVGGSVVAGLVAAGALIATLVIVFQALLGGEGEFADRIRVPATLTLLSGLTLWHLFTHLREDNALREQAEVKPFTVTVICSDPGPLPERLPDSARLRVLRRGDGLGVVDEEMAAAIASVVANNASLVWVDETGFRVAPSGPG